MNYHVRRRCLMAFVLLTTVQYTKGDGFLLPDQQQNFSSPGQIQQQQQQQFLPSQGEERRQGKHLLDFVGLGTGPNTDPYLSRVNQNCLSGELADCFKSQALGTFNEFFGKDVYHLSQSARIIRMPEYQLRSLQNEPYEYATESRDTDTEWDQLVKFALRKVEKFLKSTAFEIQIPEELSESGRYSPRFIDEISDEIDVLEDKKGSHFSRNRLKKLFIPLLIILKLFKLKLLLFLPLILGLASFKKLLGFLAIIVPGVIGYFKICKPHNNYTPEYNTGYHQYNPQGIGAANYHHHQFEAGPIYKSQQQQSFADPYSNYYREGGQATQGDFSGGGGVRFGEEPHNAQNLAYQGYSEYRNKNVDGQTV